jgi:membrane protease YdiL (CAAX protease family)
MACGIHNDGPGREKDILFDRKEQITEASVFLFLIVPSMIISFFVMKRGGIGFVLIAFSTILRDLALVSLILFFLWRNGEPLEIIGWRFNNARKEAVLGVWLFIPFFFVTGLLENSLRKLGFSAPATPLPSLIAEKTTMEFLLASVMVVIVAMAEETIFRGYLLLRFKNIMANTAAAVVISAVIFSLGHGYEGSAGVVTVWVMGLFFALVYIWRQSLVAPMVMHFLQDFIGIVLVPLVGLR